MTDDRPPIVVWAGDLHVGSKVSVAPPEFWIGDEDNKERVLATPLQKDIYNDLQSYIKLVENESEKYRPVLILAGDNCDGPIHHNSLQTWGTHEDQVSIAVQLLLPLANLAGKGHIYCLLGTSGHTGPMADLDRRIGKELGATWIGDILNLVVGGKLINAKHHFTTSRKPGACENALRILTNDVLGWSFRKGTRMPDAILRGHVHLSDSVFNTRYKVWAASSGGWKAGDSYSASLKLEIHDLGGILYYPTENRLELVEYKPRENVVVDNIIEEPLQENTLKKKRKRTP